MLLSIGLESYNFKQIWNEIAEAHKEGTPIDGYVTKRVKGGLQVRFGLLQGFLPKSQVEIKTIRNLGLYVGKTLKMKVTKLSESNNSIIFSQRALLEEERTKFFNAFREIPEKPLTLRSIERMSKTVEPIPEPNGFPLVPKAKRIPLDKSINVIVPKPVKEMIDTPPPMSTDLTEGLDTYPKNLKPESYKTVEVQHDPLYEPIDLIVPEPVKKVVDNRLPTPKNSSRVPNLQTQDLTPEPPLIGIGPYPLETINSNADSTLPGYEDFIIEQIRSLKPDTLEPDIVSDPPIVIENKMQEPPQKHGNILKEQVQNLKPDTYEAENPDNVTQQPTSETSIDSETPVESITLTRSDSSTEIDNDAFQVNEQISEGNKVDNKKKSLRYYLRRGGRFAVKKIKSTFSKKPNS